MTNEERDKAIRILQWLHDNNFLFRSTEEDVKYATKIAIQALEQEPKTGKCKDCKWWKDSDGIYRRDVGAESQCPINRREVFEGNGYCYMFEPQAESEEV